MLATDFRRWCYLSRTSCRQPWPPVLPRCLFPTDGLWRIVATCVPEQLITPSSASTRQERPTPSFLKRFLAFVIPFSCRPLPLSGQLLPPLAYVNSTSPPPPGLAPLPCERSPARIRCDGAHEAMSRPFGYNGGSRRFKAVCGKTEGREEGEARGKRRKIPGMNVHLRDYRVDCLLFTQEGDT